MTAGRCFCRPARPQFPDRSGHAEEARRKLAKFSPGSGEWCEALGLTGDAAPQVALGARGGHGGGGSRKTFGQEEAPLKAGPGVPLEPVTFC